MSRGEVGPEVVCLVHQHRRTPLPRAAQGLGAGGAPGLIAPCGERGSQVSSCSAEAKVAPRALPSREGAAGPHCLSSVGSTQTREARLSVCSEFF